MGSVLKKLWIDKKINCEPYIAETHYETIMGSVAYGVSSDTSDMDVYGFCIPSKDVVFPHVAGNILGFDQHVSFDQYQEHHIKHDNKSFDLNIYNIVKYFRLCLDNNPNMIDSLFTPQRCVLHISKIGTMVRDNRQLFLHKGSWHKFKGYAFAQLQKAKNKNPVGKRKELVDKFGYDTKFAYHIVRLVEEAKQIMIEGNIDLERNREHLKAIRRGDFKLEEIEAWFHAKELELDKVYTDSNAIPHVPRRSEIKKLLVDCLEEHFGNLEAVINVSQNREGTIRELKQLIQKL